MKKHLLALTLSFFIINLTFAQGVPVEELDAEDLNWYNKDLKEDNILGVSTERLYKNVLSKMKPKKTVLVAVIDSGVDIDHEDLQGKIWVNEDEIPNNNIDDDKNGYVDDVHGWNFLGNKNGENVNFENLEYARILKLEDKNNPHYERAVELYEAEAPQAKKELEMIGQIHEAWVGGHAFIEQKTKIKVKGLEDLRKIDSEDDDVKGVTEMLKQFYSMGVTEKQLIEGKNHYTEVVDYYTNLEFDARELVGDNPNDINDTDYGNPDVKGPKHSHGTGVSGAIAAVRNNKLGINGVAEHVMIMPVRAVPKGDEYDKDIALAIRYAVDNGADVINMSFGKDISPNKKFVDDAVKYADEKGVLLVHGSGNDGNNIDIEENYPNDQYLDKTFATNFLSVGANSAKMDEHAPADFSNYGKKGVDVFAPGVDLVGLDWASTYATQSGTSLAAPVVTGIAAVILAYYPNLKPAQIIDIIVRTAQQVDKPNKVITPGTEDDKIRFRELSLSGGVANLYDAFIEAGRISKN